MSSDPGFYVSSQRTRAFTRPIETLATRPGAATAVTAALFAGIFLLRIASGAPGDAISFLYVVPIAVAAIAFGRRGGLVAGALAFGLACLWLLTAGSEVTAFGYVNRAAIYVGLGYLVGAFATTLRALREESERLFDLTPDLICVINFEGRVVRANPTFERTLGYAGGDLYGRPFLELVHADDRPSSLEEARAVIAGEPRVDFENRCVDHHGAVHWLQWSFAAVAEEGLTYAVARDITERKALEDELERLSQHDPLTGLFNRRRFSEELERGLARAREGGFGGAVLLMDLDGFKRINDLYGHAVGDEALRAVAGVLEQNLRGGDTISRGPDPVAARLGGDEFVVILPGADAAGARTAAERIVIAVERERPRIGDLLPLELSVSVGTALYDGDGPDSVEELIAAADRAMYAVKAAGGGGASAVEPQA